MSTHWAGSQLTPQEPSLPTTAITTGLSSCPGKRHQSFDPIGVGYSQDLRCGGRGGYHFTLQLGALSVFGDDPYPLDYYILVIGKGLTYRDLGRISNHS